MERIMKILKRQENAAGVFMTGAGQISREIGSAIIWERGVHAASMWPCK
jgi:hypothetical protein